MADFSLDLKGCVKSKGVLCVPLPELLRLFEKYPYSRGKEFKALFTAATVSDKIKEVDKPE